MLAAVHVADALVDGLCTSGPGPGTELGLDLTFLEQAGVLDRLPAWRALAAETVEKARAREQKS